MTQHAHALPWTLRGLLALSAAIAAAIGLTSAPASAQPLAPGASANETRAGAISALPGTPAAPAASQPGSAGSLPPATPPSPRAATGGVHSPQVAAAARTALPPGQVWQCVIDGERIFSDAPCGEHASIRQLRELNVMDSPPAQSYAYAYPYAPLSAPAPAYAPVPADDSDYADNWGPDLLWAHGYARRDYFPGQANHLRPHPRPHPRRN